MLCSAKWPIPLDSRPGLRKMDDNDILHALHTTVHCYLSTLLAAADCLADACPPVGGPYKTKLSRLQSRLAFDSSAEAVEESAAAVAAEFKDYSAQAATYLESHAAGFRRMLTGLEQGLDVLGQRQEYYFGRLRQFASQMESASYPTDPEHLAEVIAMQSGGLLHAIECMTYELQSLATAVRSELRVAEQAVADAETTDAATGLMNRREIERRIGECRASGATYALLLFTISDHADPEVLRQVGSRLTQQLRYKDRVGRWGEHELMVLFAGPVAVAEVRIHQIVPWVAGRYVRDNGVPVDVDVETQVLSDEAVLA
jgi:hypothetical protein